MANYFCFIEEIPIGEDLNQRSESKHYDSTPFLIRKHLKFKGLVL